MQRGRITISRANFKPMGTAARCSVVTRARKIRGIILEQVRWEGGRKRELREPRTRTVNPRITSCGLGAAKGTHGRGYDRATFPRIIFPERARASDFQSRPGATETWRANIESNSQLNFNGHGCVLCGSYRGIFKHSDTCLSRRSLRARERSHLTAV